MDARIVMAIPAPAHRVFDIVGPQTEVSAFRTAELPPMRRQPHGWVSAVEGGTFSEALIERLNAVDAELKALRAEREALVPTPVDLPEDLPSLYRAYVADLASTLSDEVVAGSAADELHTLIDTVVVSWNEQKEHHELDIQGKLLELLSFGESKKAASLSTAACSLKLVAGVGFEPTTFRL